MASRAPRGIVGGSSQVLAGCRHREAPRGCARIAAPRGGFMFSTLLGALPAPAEGTEAGEADRPEAVRQNISDLEATGLELLADGLEPADATLEPKAVVARWRLAAESTTRPVKQVLEG